jgi:hypothetical protein
MITASVALEQRQWQQQQQQSYPFSMLAQNCSIRSISNNNYNTNWSYKTATEVLAVSDASAVTKTTAIAADVAADAAAITTTAAAIRAI